MYGLTDHLQEEDRYEEFIQQQYDYYIDSVPKELREELSDGVKDIVINCTDAMNLEIDSSRVTNHIKWMIDEIYSEE